MFNPFLIRLFGTMGKATYVGPRCQAVGTRPPTYDSFMLRYMNETKQMNILLTVNMRQKNLTFFHSL